MIIHHSERQFTVASDPPVTLTEVAIIKLSDGEVLTILSGAPFAQHVSDITRKEWGH